MAISPQTSTALLFTLVLCLTACRGSANPALSPGTTSSPLAQKGGAAVDFLPRSQSLVDVRLWAEAAGARSLAVSPDGTLVFVGTRKGIVYKISAADSPSPKVEVFQQGLTGSNGVCFLGPDLYLAERLRVVRFSASGGFPTGSQGEMVLSGLPDEKHHGWRYIKGGPDGRLYLSIGAPCNVCERSDDERFASICSFQPDGSDFRVEAHGVRNSVGFDWQPQTEALYFTDNGRDSLGDDIPPCELNLLGKTGAHYGFPYFWGDNQPDPEYGPKAPQGEYVAPVVKFQAHVAPLGIHFPRHQRWARTLAGKALVAEHGSWNRTVPVGYQVVAVDPGAKGNAVEPFLSGFREGDQPADTVYGRPVDVAELSDGTILVSDDHGGKIWALTPREVK